MRLALESPAQPDVLRLIDALDAFQRPLYPPESHHGIDLAALLAPAVIFAVARDTDGSALGRGAVVLEPDYAELKRMYVVPAARGRGLGQQLLSLLEASAMARHARCFAPETGYLQTAAIARCTRCGYALCAPFGSYVEDPNSVFMMKRVATA